MLSKSQIKDNEAAFQEAQRIYFISRDSEILKHRTKKSWDGMYFLVLLCVENIAKKKLKGLRVDGLDGKCTDATLLIMQKIKNGARIKKLSSFCYFYVIGELWNRKEKREDKNISYDYYLEEMKFKESSH